MSDTIVRVAIAISKLILKARWLLAALVSLMVVLIEVEEHHPIRIGALNPDFLLETIVFGVVLPILTGLLLSLLSYTEKERAKVVHSLDQRNLLAQQLNTASKWDELIEKIVAFPRNIAPAISTSLHLYNPEFDRFELAANWSVDRRSRAALHPILTREICSACDQNPFTSDAKSNLMPCTQLSGTTSESDKYCLPLIHHDHSVGVLHLDLPKGITITSSQIRVFNSVAHEMALAIDGARLQDTFTTQADATEAERKRIAQNLHDTLGQNISFLRLKLDQLTGEDVLLEISMIRQELELMREIAEDAYEQVRGTLADLNLNTAVDVRTALLDHTRSIGKRAGFEVNLVESGQPLPLPAIYKRQILYIMREAVNNIEKHAQANRVEIEFQWGEKDLSLYIRDDGSGFESSSSSPGDHYGLKIMQERAEDIHGCLTVEGLTECGTQVKLWLPVEEDKQPTLV